jgi:hypothetical protein
VWSRQAPKVAEYLLLLSEADGPICSFTSGDIPAHWPSRTSSPLTCRARLRPRTISNVEQGARENLLSQAYEELQASLSAILYEEDPLGAGSSVGSPSDEYDHEAIGFTHVEIQFAAV